MCVCVFARVSVCRCLRECMCMFLRVCVCVCVYVLNDPVCVRFRRLSALARLQHQSSAVRLVSFSIFRTIPSFVCRLEQFENITVIAML